MNHSKKVDDEVFYMDEMTDETSGPLPLPETLPIIEPRVHGNLNATPSAPSMPSPRIDGSNTVNAWVPTDALSNDIELKEENTFPETNPNTDSDVREHLNAGMSDSKVTIPADRDGMRTPGRRYSISTRPRPPARPDVNVYQQKKTLAQGMMDLALLSANANQFRYVLQTDGNHPYFYPSLVMIGFSLFLQIAVGIGLIWNSRYNIKDYPQMCKANKANNWTVIGVFLVTILNVFISSFGVVDQVPAAPLTT